MLDTVGAVVSGGLHLHTVTTFPISEALGVIPQRMAEFIGILNSSSVRLYGLPSAWAMVQ